MVHPSPCRHAMELGGGTGIAHPGHAAGLMTCGELCTLSYLVSTASYFIPVVYYQLSTIICLLSFFYCKCQLSAVACLLLAVSCQLCQLPSGICLPFSVYRQLLSIFTFCFLFTPGTTHQQ